VIIQCSSCQTRYHYDEARFGAAAVKKIKCTKCATIFEIRNPSIPVAPPDFQPEETGPLNSPVLGSDDFALDTTVMGGGPRKKPPNPPPLPPHLQALMSAPPAPRPGVVPPPVPMPRAPSHATTTGEHEAPAIAPGGEGRLRLPDDHRISLACLAGPDSGRIFEIVKPRMTLGRANADIVLTDAQCSRQHAAIEVVSDQTFLVDLGSTNGTFFGEKRISRIELDNRAEFDVGATTLMYIKTRKD